jgi:hypothetical protein
MPFDANEPPRTSDLFRLLNQAIKRRNELAHPDKSKVASTTEPTRAGRQPSTGRDQTTIVPDFDGTLANDGLEAYEKEES